MSSFLKTFIRKKKIFTYVNEVFIQDTTIDTMLQTLDQYHAIIKHKNLKAAPDKSFCFLNAVKFLGHQVQNNHIQTLQSKTDNFCKIATTKKQGKKPKQ